MHFETAFKYVILKEGEQSNDPTDRGGFTRYGITEEVAKGHRCFQHPQGVNVRTVDVPMARHIYLLDYWELDGIKDVGVAVKIFDWQVNFGVKTVSMLAQETANLFGHKLTVDGVLGNKSATAINSIDPERFLDALEDFADKRYADIVINDFIAKYGKAAFQKMQLKFLKGWLSRSNKRYYI